MKRLIWLVALIFAVTSIAGCASLQRKFTRKKKDQKKIPRIVQTKKYVKKPTPELYSQHYAYWQSWSSEIIQRLGDNRKKDMRCMEEMVGQLNDMRGILVPEKGDQLAKHIRRYQDVRDIINREPLSDTNKNSVRMTLEREDRIINNEFCLSKVRNYLKKSFDDEEGGQAQDAAMQDAGADVK